MRGTVLPKVRFSLEKKKSNKIVCTSWHLVKFSFFYTKSSIALTLSWLITTSLINFESVTLEFHHAKYLLQQEKTLFKTTFFFFSFQMYELIYDSQEGNGRINTRDKNVSKNRLTHTRSHTHQKNLYKMLWSMRTGEKKNLSTMLQFKSQKKKKKKFGSFFLPHVRKCHPIFLKQE